jgi:pimeloyl-ACP methyl ester esterase
VDITSGAVRLHVSERGVGHPVLFLHGWMADSTVFDPVLDVVCRDQGLRAITMDLRGHGRSGKPAEGYGVEEHSHDVDAVHDACSLGEVTLVGWSLGGAVALHYAATRPNRVQKIVLAGATPSLVQQPGFAAATPPDAFTGLLGALLADFPATTGQFIAAQLPEPGSEDAAQVLHDCAMRTTGAAAVAAAEAVGRHDLREFVSLVDVPALILHGGLDAVVPPQAGQWLAENLPKVERHVQWPDRGHCPFLTSPELVAEEISAFV